MNNYLSWAKPRNFGRFSILGLLSCASLLISCNVAERSNLKVAGGEIDGTNGKPAAYPGTVYVELNGQDFGDGRHLLRNVGNIVDVGLKDRYVLILSLADVFKDNGGVAVMPIMKTLDVTLYTSDKSAKFELPKLEMIKGGFFKGGSYDRYFMFSVGVKATKTGKSTADVDSKVGRVAERIFMEAELPIQGGGNLRDAFTSYTMIAIPKSDLTFLPADFKVPVLAAEQRQVSDKQEIVMVGFGDRDSGKDKTENGFALSEELPNVMARNFASVAVIKDYQGKPTPFRQKIGDNEITARQLWEVSGSGLCGSKDGHNYDTGAGIYIDGQFAGFAIKSTTISSGFTGSLVCGTTSRTNMATLVVSPSKEQIDEFKFFADQVLN